MIKLPLIPATLVDRFATGSGPSAGVTCSPWRVHSRRRWPYCSSSACPSGEARRQRACPSLAPAFAFGPQQGALEKGFPAPDLVGADGTGLTDLDGLPVELEDIPGRPTWVFFWATWCPPCQQETPDIQRISEARGDDLIILGIRRAGAC